METLADAACEFRRARPCSVGLSMAAATTEFDLAGKGFARSKGFISLLSNPRNVIHKRETKCRSDRASGPLVAANLRPSNDGYACIDSGRRVTAILSATRSKGECTRHKEVRLGKYFLASRAGAERVNGLSESVT